MELDGYIPWLYHHLKTVTYPSTNRTRRGLCDEHHYATPQTVRVDTTDHITFSTNMVSKYFGKSRYYW